LSYPVLTIIAGSNGCGKSTLTASARSIFQQDSVLDPDARAKSIQQTLAGNYSDIEAGKRVLHHAEELIAKRQSFTVETTLSGSTYLKMVARAKEAGFNIRVIFIGTATVEINIERVRSRVEIGGHDVPEEDQRRRYPRTLANMKRLLPEADYAVILDNSSEDGYVLVAYGDKGHLRWSEPVPEWAAFLRG